MPASAPRDLAEQPSLLPDLGVVVLAPESPPALPSAPASHSAGQRSATSSSAVGHLVSSGKMPTICTVCLPSRTPRGADSPSTDPQSTKGHSRAPLSRCGPRVRGLHRERPFCGTHHEALTRNELDDLIRVREPPAEEVRHEREPRAHCQRRRRPPFHGLDVDVPARPMGFPRILFGASSVCGVCAVGPPNRARGSLLPI